MTVIVNPSGSPTVVYSESGTTIDSITSAGTTQGTATPIVRYSEWTVVVVANGAGFGVSGSGCVLPANAQIGDVVETHFPGPGGATAWLYPSSGFTIDGGPANNPIGLANACVRLVNSTDWYPL